MLLVPLLAFSLTPEKNSKGKKPVSAPVQQPIPFSHKQHAKLGLECSLCHRMAGTGEKAGLPSVADCISCHETIKKDSPAIQKLAASYEEDKPIPWVRLYQLSDFVFFSHNKHQDAKVECETCHGPVHTRDVLWKEKEISMKACVDCHKASNASVACNLCHELNQ